MGAQQGAFVHRQRNAPSEWFSEGRSSKFPRVELPKVQYCFSFWCSLFNQRKKMIEFERFLFLLFVINSWKFNSGILKKKKHVCSAVLRNNYDYLLLNAKLNWLCWFPFLRWCYFQVCYRTDETIWWGWVEIHGGGYRS